MTATADQARPLMADLSEPEPARAGPQAAATGRPARPRLRDQIAENPLLTLMGSIIIALLVFTLGTTNLRINDIHARIDDTNARIDRLEVRMDRLEERVINIDLKLTALIAALNATEEVDAALHGRLLQPGAGEQDPVPAER
ncbi:MAG: hypothetical protein OXG40_02620 [Acidimicrobiaceae bacterium]|nr:hypothetical protein [Acidimicrobiaceae bacterium]MDE0516889.1 hypothetical protein [Acidimicrobiaceae bacterium]